MSGHSKWSQIKRQKSLADAKRGAVFTKLSNAITIAVKEGGGISDPAQNFKLRLAFDAAKSANMPKENIERAIKRAGTPSGGGELKEIVYEGFAPGGISVIIEVATDNANRTTAEIKSVFNEAGASLAQPGAVSYQFQDVGEIVLNKNDQSIEDIFLQVAEAGALDIEDRGEEAVVYTNPASLMAVKDSLEQRGLSVQDAGLSKKPNITVKLSSEEESRVLNFLSTLDALDYVQKVYSNIN